jgi:hypothetical protein
LLLLLWLQEQWWHEFELALLALEFVVVVSSSALLCRCFQK